MTDVTSDPLAWRPLKAPSLAELELLAIYFIVIAVLLLRPAGLFGRSLV